MFVRGIGLVEHVEGRGTTRGTTTTTRRRKTEKKGKNVKRRDRKKIEVSSRAIDCWGRGNAELRS